MLCIALSEDGKVFVSGSFNGRRQRWDLQSGAEIGDELIGDLDHVSCIAGDGRVVVSGSKDGTIRRWDRQAQLRAGGSGSSQNCNSKFDFVISSPTDMVCLAMNFHSQLSV